VEPHAGGRMTAEWAGTGQPADTRPYRWGGTPAERDKRRCFSPTLRELYPDGMTYGEAMKAGYYMIRDWDGVYIWVLAGEMVPYDPAAEPPPVPADPREQVEKARAWLDALRGAVPTAGDLAVLRAIVK
jgi:hypothetical protein